MATQSRWTNAKANRSAATGYANPEMSDRIIELLDVSQHAHRRMVRAGRCRRPCSAGKRSELYGESVPARGALAPRTDATRWRYERLFLERLVPVPEKLA
jgi:hypothetical protein